MRAFFDDMLAAIFVLAVLAASYIFLFMGTVQSGTMMSNALQHRIKIEQLQSATQAFRYIVEPNTKENLAYIVGMAASTGARQVWVSGTAVDAVAATEGALSQLLGQNYQLSVELPSRQVELVFVVAQSPTMVEEKDKLLAVMPELRNLLSERGLNATIFSYFLSYSSCGFEWCDNSTQKIVSCAQMYLPVERGESHYNIGTAVSQISQVQGMGLKVIVPLTDSLSTGNAPDSCFTSCNPGLFCSWCSTGCSSTRSDSSLRQAGLQATINRAAVCPIAFSKCSLLNDEAKSHYSCLGVSSMEQLCPSCSGCRQEWGEFCFSSCDNEVIKQMETLGSATGCEASLIRTSELLETIVLHVEKAVAENKFRVGRDPPKEHTIYSEDLVLPTPSPLKARLTIW